MAKKKKRGKGRSRRERKRRDERLAEVALEKWLECQESAVSMAMDMKDGRLDGEVVTDEHGMEVCMSGSTVSFGNSEKDAWLSNTVANALPEASVFVMAPDQYATYLHEAEVYCTEVLAGHEWSRIPDGDPGKQWLRDEELARQRYDAIAKESRTMGPPDPERWPFESMWISFGAGHTLTDIHMAARLQRETIQGLGMMQVTVLGQLWTMTDRGPLITEAMEFISMTGETGPVAGVCWTVVWSPTQETAGWRHPYDHNPWVCHALHQHLLDFRTFIVEREWKPHQTNRPGDGPPTVVERRAIPKPYYLVKLKSQVIEKGFRTALPRRRKFEYQHQFKVRGHYRVRIKRGTLPMPEEAREILAQRGYTIYTLGQMSQEHTHMLLERGIPVKRTNEWLAILVSWVKDYTKGPADGPFVPSVRVA